MGIDAKYNRQEYGNDNKQRGICPEGWHMPSLPEWETLTDFVGGSSTAGTILKAASGWKSEGNGTDDYGFSALPGGWRRGDGTFWDADDRGLWWSATDQNAYRAYFWKENEESPGEETLYSVRCVKD